MPFALTSSRSSCVGFLRTGFPALKLLCRQRRQPFNPKPAAVGSELHLTGEHVRQIQEHALETLRAAGSAVLSEVVAEYVEAEALDSEADRLGA
jgi:hypothetical protein